MSEWRTVNWKGFDLEVSDDQQVRRPAVRTEFQQVRCGIPSTKVAVFPARELKPYVTQGGYVEVGFVASRRRYRALLHRLVAMAFCDGYAEDKCVNHINGDKLDNRPSNLEWVTLAENTAHAWTTGLVDLNGDKQPGSKLTPTQVRAIRRLLDGGASCNAIAEAVGVSSSTIYFIRDGKRWANVA